MRFQRLRPRPKKPPIFSLSGDVKISCIETCPCMGSPRDVDNTFSVHYFEVSYLSPTIFFKENTKEIKYFQ